jgi:dTDP-4-amino-4,6-dideoxygalactose transaminase
MQIPFLDLGATYQELRKEIDDAVQRVLNSGWYILGEEVEAFELEWADYCGAAYAVGLGNGLDALTLSLKALGIGPGDEVVVPSNTYIATWLAVSALGAKPIPVEPDPFTYNLDPTRIEKAITVNTRVILPVHLYGHPADLDPILVLARKYGLYVVEDAAQAHGSSYKNRPIGAHGDVVCWSFYPGKNLGAFGDAGAITTNSNELAERIKILRNYGSQRKYVNEVQGVNSRLDPIQAAVLRAKLPYLNEWTTRRRGIAEAYSKNLAGLNLTLPVVADWAEHSWHLYVVKTKDRAYLQKKLNEAGVGTLIHYPIPPHLQSAYAGTTFKSSDLTIATYLSKEVLSLPIGPQMSSEMVDYTVRALNDCLG